MGGTTTIRSNFKQIIMAYSTCCGAYSRMPEIDICPDCRDHCDWEDEEEDDEPSDNQINNNHRTEGEISFTSPAWNGR
jgi:hypothetical protein